MDPLSLPWLRCFSFPTKNYNFCIITSFVSPSKTTEENTCPLPPSQASGYKTIPSLSQWEKDTYSHLLINTKWIPSWAFQNMPSAMFHQCQISIYKKRNKTEKNNLWKTIGSAWVLIRLANHNPAIFLSHPGIENLNKFPLVDKKPR